MGIIPTLWSSPNYGKLQFISQFSYVVRSPWYVAPAKAPERARVHRVHQSAIHRSVGGRYENGAPS